MARYFEERAAPAVWLGSCYRNHRAIGPPVQLVRYRSSACMLAAVTRAACTTHGAPPRGTQMPGDQSPSAVSSDV